MMRPDPAVLLLLKRMGCNHTKLATAAPPEPAPPTPPLTPPPIIYLFVEEYVDTPKEPSDDPVIPHADLEEVRNIPLTNKSSFRRRIIHGNPDILRVFKINYKKKCPICQEKTIPQVAYKINHPPNEHIIKNGGFHTHCKHDILVPHKCKNGHLVKLVYGFRCECGWPQKYSESNKIHIIE